MPLVAWPFYFYSTVSLPPILRAEPFDGSQNNPPETGDETRLAGSKC